MTITSIIRHPALVYARFPELLLKCNCCTFSIKHSKPLLAVILNSSYRKTEAYAYTAFVIHTTCRQKFEHCKISYKTFLPEDLISKGKKILLNSMIEENQTTRFEDIFTINIFALLFLQKK